ncbi:MAG: putative Ig domain-containing protein [Bryobacteraceae bacterium]|nr:putative Ig domain-containing protein [Bryobacteraceae bacterium]
MTSVFARWAPVLALVLAAPVCAQVTIDVSELPEGQVGVPYDYTVPLSNTTSTTWCGLVDPLQKPPGLQVGCRITGTPSMHGEFGFEFYANTLGGGGATRYFTLRVREGVYIEYSQMDGQVGTPVALGAPSFRVSGAAPYQYSVESGSLAPGLQLNPATGAVSGTPITGGDYEATIRIVDAQGRWGVARLQMRINGPPSLQLVPNPVTGAQLPPGKSGFPYSFQFSASGGTAPYQFVARDYGNGLSINTAGLLSGAPTRLGFTSVEVEARDAHANSTGRFNYSIQVAMGGSINWTMMPARTLGVPFTWNFTVSGLGAGLQAGVTGALPPGLAVVMGPGANEGRIAGTPTTAGDYDFVLRITDGAGAYVESTQRLTFVGTSATPLSIDTDRMPDAMAGDPYSYQIPVSGGTPPYTFSIVNLPQGLTVGAQTGVVSGSTVQPFEYSISVQVRDAVLGSAQKSLPFKGESRNLEYLTVTTAPAPEMAVGWKYSLVFNVTGGAGPPYTMAVTDGVSPPGLELRGVGGGNFLLDGSPVQAGTFDFELRATDRNGWYGRKQVRIVVKPLTLTILPEVLAGEVVEGTHRQWQLSVAGGTPPLDWKIGSSEASSVFGVASGGLLSALPQPPGEREVRVNVKDAAGQYGSRVYRVTVVPGGLTVDGFPVRGRIHAAYEFRFTASGGTGPYTFSQYEGELPEGLGVQPDGRLAGTPRQAGTFRFAVRALDAAGRSGTKNVELQVDGRLLDVRPEELPDAQSGEPYAVQFTATGGQGPYRFLIHESHNWFYGFTLSEAGLLSGSAVTEQDVKVRFQVSVMDAEGSYGNAWREFWFRGKAGLQMGPVELPAANVGASYRAAIMVSGGTQPYTFRITSGGLPAGLNLRADGEILGMPQQEGAYPLTIEVTDATGAKVSRSYTLAVGNEALRIEPSMLPAMARGVAVSVDLRGEGGTAPYRFSLSGGPLPAGLALTEQGRLSGTPAGAGAYAFTVGMTDATGRYVSRQYTGTVVESSGGGGALRVVTDSLPVMAVGTAVSVQLQAAGGIPPYVFERASGTLPPGVTLSGSGLFSGTPTGAGTFVFQVQVADAAFARVSRSFTVAVQGTGLRITPAVLPKAQYEQGYRVDLKGEGGTGPYGFILSQGELPPSFQLQSNGVLTGYPRHSRAYTFTIQVRDSSGQLAEQQYVLEVEGGGLVMAPAQVTPFPVGRAYALDITTSGGQAPFAYTLKGGALPRGLTMNGQGQVRGTPEEAGVFTIVVEVKDFHGETAEKEFRLQVNGLTVLPESLPEFGAGAAVDVQFRTEPVLAGTTFAAAGTLPAGLTLTAQGRLSGTLSGVADGALVIQAMWNGGVAGVREYRFLASQPLAIKTEELPEAVVGRYYRAQVEAMGGRAPYQFRALAGPAGVGVHPHGFVDGMLAEAGEFELNVEVVDVAGVRASRRIRLTAAAAAFVIETTWLEAAREGVLYEARLRAGGGVERRWTVVEGMLPAGLRLSPEGVLGGVPAEAGTFVFTVKAEGEGAAFQTLTLVVEAAETAGRVTVYPLELGLTGVAGEATERRACAGVFGANEGAGIQAVVAGGAGWLRAAVEAGRVCVAATAEGLAAGVWPAVVEVRVSGGVPELVRVPVEFRVAEAGTGVRAWPAEVVLGAGVADVRLTNLGTAAVVVDLSAAGDWLEVNPAVLSLDAGEAGVIQVGVRSAGQSPGLYEGAIEARVGGVEVLRVPVRWQAGLAAKRLGANVSQVEFVAWEGGAAPGAQTVLLRNDGVEEVEPRVAVEGAWLRAGECRVLPGGAVCALSVTVETEGLAAGDYRGRLVVSGGALPVEVGVMLRVMEREAVVPAEPMSVLLLIPESGAAAVRPVDILGSPGRRGPVEILMPAAEWLRVGPERPEVGADGFLRLEIGAVGLAGGRHEAAAVLRFANGEMQVLTVLAVVAGEECAGGHVLLLEPGEGFRAVVGHALRVRAAVVLCGGGQVSGQVLTGALDGEGFLLTSDGEGLFEGEVTPWRASDAAELVVGVAGGASARVWGRVRSEERPGPVVQVVKTGAGLPGPAAPDARIRLEGVNLGVEEVWSEQLMEELGGVRVTLGGMPLQLGLVSPGRIDGYIPAAMPSGVVAGLVVSGPAGESRPVQVVVVEAHPQIYTLDETGTGVALASHAGTGVAVSAAAPAEAGGEVRMYVSGMGAGGVVGVMVEGVAAEVTGVGALEGYPGLREVRFRVPALTGEARLGSVELRLGTLVSNRVGLHVKP